MTGKIFSPNFRTFGAWLKAQTRESKYAKEIIRKHERFPNLSLGDLRNLKMSDAFLNHLSWDSLSPNEKSERKLAFEVLRSMRKGEKLKPVLKRLGLKHDFVTKHLGEYVYKKRGYWRVTQSDRIEAQMVMNAKNFGRISVVTTNSEDRKKIASYMSAVGKALRTGDPSVLKKFRDMKIHDADGNVYQFETDLDALYEIEEAQEEPEFFEIYQD